MDSEKSGIWYVGLSGDPIEQLKQHNKGKSRFTKEYIPWKLIYTELSGDLKQARELEKFYKTKSGKNKLKNILGLQSG
ncbi:MAG: GIY-YIG nuclease family protein [Mariniphaga sp.]|nr:GIY-YIG nuclease family protein [Mariniphaga sp.]